MPEPLPAEDEGEDEAAAGPISIAVDVNEPTDAESAAPQAPAPVAAS
jgi:exoribonuclease II